MSKGALSNCERQFIVQTFLESHRIDGRSLEDYSDLVLEFGTAPGTALVTLGDTKCLARVSCSLGEPRDSRPKEGILFVNAEMSRLAGPMYDSNAGSAAQKANERQIELTRLLERLFKESGCLNTEALCVRAGKLVWHVRLDIHVLDDDGCLPDCASAAACAALAHFRLPQVTCTGRAQVQVHPLDQREPVPLYLYHMPVCVTFGYGEHAPSVAVVEPNGREEMALHGCVVVACNKRKELCALHCTGKAMRLKKDELVRCASRGNRRAAQVTEYLEEALRKHTQLLQDTSRQIALGQQLATTSTGFALAMSNRKLGRTCVLKAQECVFPLDQQLPLGLDKVLPVASEATASAPNVSVQGSTAHLGRVAKKSQLFDKTVGDTDDVSIVREIVKSTKDGKRSRSSNRKSDTLESNARACPVKNENRDSLLDDIEADVVVLTGGTMNFGDEPKPNQNSKPAAPPVVDLTLALKNRKKKKAK